MTGGLLTPLTFFVPDRAPPERQRLHAEFVSRHSFREAAPLMAIFLLCHPSHHMTVRSRIGRISEELEQTRSTSGDLANRIPKGGLVVIKSEAYLEAVVLFHAGAACQGRRSGTGPDIRIYR